MKTLHEDSHAQINLNQELSTMELVWKGVVTEQVYRDTFSKGLELLIAESAKNWISDIRKQGIIGPDSAQWLQKYIIPKAMQNGLKKIAVVMNEDVFKKFYVDNLQKSVDSNSLMQYFKSMEDAYNWIKG